MPTKKRYLETLWEVWTYDVWGNARDGYEVNDRSCIHREYKMRLRLEVNNPGTPHTFDSAAPTDRQIREALDLKPRVRISTDGDDTTIYVEHESTGYPLGELNCVSHESLSPPRAVSKVQP